MERCYHDISNVEIDLKNLWFYCELDEKVWKTFYKIFFMEDYLKFLNSYNTSTLNLAFNLIPVNPLEKQSTILIANKDTADGHGDIELVFFQD